MPPESKQSTERQRNARCLFEHTQAESRHDLNGTLATLHPDAVFEDAAVGLHLSGRGEAARHYQLWWKAFQLQTEGGVIHWIDDSLLIGEAHFVGTHVGEFLGLAPTAKAIRLPFMVRVSFREGLLSQERFYYDLNGLLTQLGQPAFSVSVLKTERP